MFKRIKLSEDNFFEKWAKAFRKHPLILFLILFLIFFLAFFFIFYKHFYLIDKTDINLEDTRISLQENFYNQIIKEWDNREEELVKISQKNYSNPFALGQRIIVIPEEPPQEDIELNDLTHEELEDLLVSTIFQLYTARGERMPSIVERSSIWEELGLGMAEEYKGTYSQNIIFLSALKKQIAQ